MSNPTNPFNWQMPTAVDLVTDLPADFEVFGQAVATSMADLLGGTTGQILSKNSNTDMDFVWTSPNPGDITGITATSPLTGGGTSGDVTVGIQAASTSQSGAVQLTDSTSSTSTTTAATPNAVKTSYDLAAAAIPKSTVTTNGDLIYGTGSGTVSRIGVGSSGQVLTVSGGVPAWATASSGSTNVAGKNGILNSNFSMWQRGTSISLAANAGITYLADRWATQTAANQACTVSRQVTGDTTNLPFIQYCLRYQRNSGQTGTDALSIIQPFESVNSIPFAGKTVTFSFYARAGANFSAASSLLYYLVRTGTGTDQMPFNAYTGGSTSYTGTVTLTTTWQRFTATATIPTTATEIAPQFYFIPVGTAGANDYYEVTGVQLETASTATAYSPNAGTFQGELAACQRYYYRAVADTAYGSVAPYAVAASSSGFISMIQPPVTMRVSPTSIDFSTLAFVNYADTLYAASSLSLPANNNKQVILVSGSMTGATAGHAGRLTGNNSTAAYLGFSAEL